MAYAIIRVQRLKTINDLHAATRHGRRQDRGTHYDPDRTRLNRHWANGEWGQSPADWANEFDALIEARQAQVRANGARGAEILLSASGSFFTTPGTDETDMAKVELWLAATVNALMARYPGMIATMRLDLDEATPHLAVGVVPLYVKKTKHTTAVGVSYRKVFGGDTKIDAANNMRALQDWYALAMAPLGLERGISKVKTQRPHLSHWQYAAHMRAQDAKRENDVTEAAALAQKARDTQAQIDIKLQMVTLALSQAALYRRNAHALLKEAEKRTVWLDKAYKTAIAVGLSPDAANAVTRSQERLSSAKDQVTHLQTELDNTEDHSVLPDIGPSP